MKEFSITFDKGLSSGLRSSESNPRNKQALTECYNLKPDVLGLLPYEPVIDESGALSLSWPYPQIFIGSDYRYICTNTKIYTMDSSWNQTLKVTTTASGIWDFADFGTYVLFVNGAKIVERSPVDGSYTASDTLTDMPRFSTVCNFKGQVIGGNVKSTWHGCGTNSVVWSAIGTNDFTPGVDNVKGSMNEAGFRHMRWEGEIYRVKRLGNAVIIYGDNGIDALVPYESTFGLKEILDKGIASKGAVGGSWNEHVFVDKEGYLWRIKSDLSTERLGYKEYISLIDLTEVMVSYDGSKREYYIADDTYGYLLTHWGLCQVYQKVTSVASIDGTSYGVTSDGSDDEGRVVTDVIDFGVRGFKTIGLLEAGIYHPAGSTYKGYATVDWRSNKTDSFTRRDWVLMNPNGVATVMTAGDEFRLCVKADNYQNMQLDYINARVKVTDRRFMRGLTAGNIGDITE